MKKSLREIIYNRIRENITCGKLAPAERLVEDRLAEEFKASRSPVREALRLLEAEGLVSFERNKGFTVAKLSIKQVDEIFELRSLLESYAARRAAERISKKGVARLWEYQAQQRSAAQSVDLQAWLRANNLFHNSLYSHCDNSLLIQSINNLKRRVNRYHFVTVTVPWQFDTYLEQHEAILQACEKNDGELVEKYMKEHMDTTKEALKNQLQNRGVVF